jgi:hypothetical protein
MRIFFEGLTSDDRAPLVAALERDWEWDIADLSHRKITSLRRKETDLIVYKPYTLKALFIWVFALILGIPTVKLSWPYNEKRSVKRISEKNKNLVTFKVCFVGYTEPTKRAIFRTLKKKVLSVVNTSGMEVDRIKPTNNILLVINSASSSPHAKLAKAHAKTEGIPCLHVNAAINTVATQTAEKIKQLRARK